MTSPVRGYEYLHQEAEAGPFYRGKRNSGGDNPHFYPVATMRGIFWGLLLSIPLWALIVVGILAVLHYR